MRCASSEIYLWTLLHSRPGLASNLDFHFETEMKRTEKMKAVGVDARARKIAIVDHPVPNKLEADEVKIRTLEVGVCGTDKEICSFAYGSPPVGDHYLILGHECLGEVVETGSAI